MESRGNKPSRQELLVQLEVAELYYEILCREPDSEGLNYYTNEILKEGKNIEWVKNLLISSPEAKSKKEQNSN